MSFPSLSSVLARFHIFFESWLQYASGYFRRQPKKVSSKIYCVAKDHMLKVSHENTNDESTKCWYWTSGRRGRVGDVGENSSVTNFVKFVNPARFFDPKPNRTAAQQHLEHTLLIQSLDFCSLVVSVSNSAPFLFTQVHPQCLVRASWHLSVKRNAIVWYRAKMRLAL